MDQTGRKIEDIRHSLAHILAMAVLERWPSAKLGVGPVIENGFFYDFELPEPVKPEDLSDLETRMRRIIGQNLDFSGRQVSFEEARQIFREKNQPYKLELIDDLEMYGTTEVHKHETKELEIRNSKLGKLETVGLYQTGDFVDLCRGGHVANTRELNPDAFRLTKTAGAYWRGSEKNPMLTRIYAVAFRTPKELDDYLKLQEELGRRDHRKIGEALDLFSFHDVAPGAPFWHPKGMIIFKELEKFWRQIHEGAGYREISTPILVKEEVFRKSGHTEHYRENMFPVKVDDENFYLKPMNCPESTYVYAAEVRSYRDLPLRFSEIGRLHRNELSGTLGGLFRVRQITMDDAHIYCRPDQIQKEIAAVLKLVKRFYKLFGLELTFYFATKPDKALGEPKLWVASEKMIETALKQSKANFKIKPKEGAFYGPKIDVHVKDALGRDWQLATIQVDPNLAERFDLSYTGEDGQKQRPIVIHRAIFGSFERFIGILIEHYAGNLPLWLAPVQAVVIPVSDKFNAYGREVFEKLAAAGLRLELWNQNESVGKKIREGELQKIPYLLVVGDKEKKAKSVRVRQRGKGDIGMQKFDKFAKAALDRISSRK